MNLQSMAQALNNVEKRELYYAGNLRRDKKLKSLSHHHFIVPDCDDLGNLLPAYVFVQFIGIKKSASFDHLLICKQCNEEAETNFNARENYRRFFDQPEKEILHPQ